MRLPCTGVLECWSVEYKSGKRSDFYSFTLVFPDPIPVHITPSLQYSSAPGMINLLSAVFNFSFELFAVCGIVINEL